jgi:hypothetical protein
LEYVFGFAWHSVRKAADVIDQLTGLFQEVDRVGTVAHGLELEFPILGDSVGRTEAAEGSPGRIMDALDA